MNIRKKIVYYCKMEEIQHDESGEQLPTENLLPKVWEYTDFLEKDEKLLIEDVETCKTILENLAKGMLKVMAENNGDSGEEEIERIASSTAQSFLLSVIANKAKREKSPAGRAEKLQAAYAQKEAAHATLGQLIEEVVLIIRKFSGRLQKADFEGDLSSELVIKTMHILEPQYKVAAAMEKLKDEIQRLSLEIHRLDLEITGETRIM